MKNFQLKDYLLINSYLIRKIEILYLKRIIDNRDIVSQIKSQQKSKKNEQSAR